MESEGAKKVEITAKDKKHQITAVLAGSLSSSPDNLWREDNKMLTCCQI